MVFSESEKMFFSVIELRSTGIRFFNLLHVFFLVYLIASLLNCFRSSTKALPYKFPFIHNVVFVRQG